MYQHRWAQDGDEMPSSKKKRQSWHLAYVMRHFVDNVRCAIMGRSNAQVDRTGGQTTSAWRVHSQGTQALCIAYNLMTKSS